MDSMIILGGINVLFGVVNAIIAEKGKTGWICSVCGWSVVIINAL